MRRLRSALLDRRGGRGGDHDGRRGRPTGFDRGATPAHGRGRGAPQAATRASGRNNTTLGGVSPPSHINISLPFRVHPRSPTVDWAGRERFYKVSFDRPPSVCVPCVATPRRPGIGTSSCTAPPRRRRTGLGRHPRVGCPEEDGKHRLAPTLGRAGRARGIARSRRARRSPRGGSRRATRTTTAPNCRAGTPRSEQVREAKRRASWECHVARVGTEAAA